MKLSFEIFPARTPKGILALENNLHSMKTHNPDYVSVTCGAFGSPREGTEFWIEKLHQNKLTPIAHVTSAFLDKTELRQTIQQAQKSGAKGIVALRGDMPDNHSPKSSVLDLIACAKELPRVCVSGYPTPHVESRGLDFDWLKSKQDAGATEIITQFVFNPEEILTFRDSLFKHGINLTLRPGLLPFHNWQGAQKFAAKTGVPVCNTLAARFENTDDEKTLATKVAHEFLDLWDQENIQHAHLYTLNQSPDWLGEDTGHQNAHRLRALS